MFINKNNGLVKLRNITELNESHDSNFNIK